MQMIDQNNKKICLREIIKIIYLDYKNVLKSKKKANHRYRCIYKHNSRFARYAVTSKNKNNSIGAIGAIGAISSQKYLVSDFGASI